MNKALTVSIIIPVYNEERTIGACLEAIQRQTTAPLEVVVVDNNSTDETLNIVRKFKHVTVVHEKQQGALYARTTGFNEAKGQIIGRIDADTRLEPNWVAELQTIMQDESVAAVTGSSHWYDMPLSPWNHKIEHFFKNNLFQHEKNFPFLFGTNMAIRASSWRAVRKSLCDQKYIFEDADLAIHLAQSGKKILYDARLRAGMSARRYADSPRNFWRYIRLQSITYKQHGIQTIGSSIAVGVYLLGYVILRPLVLSYDQTNGKRSLKKLFTSPVKARRLPFD